MSVKATITAILEKTSASFKALQAIQKWDASTLFVNLGVILQAAKDGFDAIEQIKATAEGIVDDEAAQAELAAALDDAIKLNAMLEMFDGLVFQVAVKMACTAIKSYVKAETKTA